MAQGQQHRHRPQATTIVAIQFLFAFVPTKLSGGLPAIVIVGSCIVSSATKVRVTVLPGMAVLDHISILV